MNRTLNAIASIGLCLGLGFGTLVLVESLLGEEAIGQQDIATGPLPVDPSIPDPFAPPEPPPAPPPAPMPIDPLPVPHCTPIPGGCIRTLSVTEAV